MLLAGGALAALAAAGGFLYWRHRQQKAQEEVRGLWPALTEPIGSLQH
jgi:hypothetical protein